MKKKLKLFLIMMFVLYLLPISVFAKSKGDYTGEVEGISITDVYFLDTKGPKKIAVEMKNTNLYPVQGGFWLKYYKDGKLVEDSAISLPSDGLEPSKEYTATAFVFFNESDFDEVKFENATIREKT